ncbi:hypothetical protein EK21DRAFT_92828 [Setomelanomma holmii]|uniref:Uncharacterized protein n=1 Tax=Setomelanomma holmii TaxID=210430 RepID=A0A9P4H1N5_9PLEO|nr:hypothetical protein EK21DRAFT_92828 [Setomelanomma holmii]
MATTSTDVRATTILQGPADWTPWYSAKRRYATIKGVWQYCNPDSTAESPTPVAEPSDNSSVDAWKIWEIKSRHQESILKAIDQQRRLELATLYSDIQKKPKNQSVQAWLNEYSQITSQCAQESMPEMTETRAQWRFIYAVRDPGDEAWAQAQFLAMEQGEANKLWPTPTLQRLISRYRRTAPTSTAQNTTKTLGGFKTQASLLITEQAPKPKGRSTCVCGLHSSIFLCFSLNLEAKGRLKDFKPSSKALCQLVEAFRNNDTLKRAQKAYKDAGIRWTFDEEKAKAELSERRKDNSTSCQTHRTETRDDDSSDGYVSNAAYFTQLLQSNAASSTHDRSLQN